MNVRSFGGRTFTLIELLLVMVILTILASVIIVRFYGQRQKAEIAAAKTDISSIETAIDTFQVNCGRFPSNDEGLSVLAKNSGIEGWTGPYIKLVPHDPWGSDYIYQAPGTYFPESYDLHSLGPDKREGNDDIANWQS